MTMATVVLLNLSTSWLVQDDDAAQAERRSVSNNCASYISVYLSTRWYTMYSHYYEDTNRKADIRGLCL